MRILFWMLGFVGLLFALSAGYIAMLLSGLLSLNLVVENGNFLHKQIEESSDLKIVLHSPIDVRISDTFTVKSQRFSIPSANGTEGNSLLEVSNLRVEGRIDLDTLLGDIPIVDDLSIEKISAELTRDNNGEFILPKQFMADAFETLLHQQDDGKGFALISRAYAQEILLSNFPIRKAKIEEFNLIIHDLEKENNVHMQDINLFMPNESREGIFSAEGNLNGTDLDIDVGVTSRGSVSGLVRFAGINTDLSGEFFPLIQVELKSVVNDLAPLSDFLRAPLPKGPFRLEVSIVEERKGLFDVKLKKLVSSNSDLSGTLKVSVLGRAFVADLRSEVFVLNDFLPVALEEKGNQQSRDQRKNNTQPDGRAIPDMPMPAVFLQKSLLPEFADIRGTIKFKKLDLDGFILDNLLSNVRIEEKSAGIDIKEIGLGLGGKADGSFTLELGERPKFAGKINAHNVPVSTFQRYIPQISKIDGLLNGNVVLTSQGKDLREVASNLDGTVDIGMFAGYLQLPKTTTNLLNAISPALLDEGVLIVECSNIHGSFSQGRSDDLTTLLKSRALVSYGDGKVNLSSETIDSLILSEFRVFGARLALPLEIKNTLGAPDFTADFKSLVSGKVKRRPELPDESVSNCHQKVVDSSARAFDGLPSGLSLSVLKNSLTDINIDDADKTIQDRIKDKLKSGFQKKIEGSLQSLSSSTTKEGETNILQNAAKNLLNQGDSGKSNEGNDLKKAGKSLLKGLFD